MTENEYRAAALGIMVYNHIASTGKMPELDATGMDLDVEGINEKFFSMALKKIKSIDMSHITMTVTDCSGLREGENENRDT